MKSWRVLDSPLNMAGNIIYPTQWRPRDFVPAEDCTSLGKGQANKDWKWKHAFCGDRDSHPRKGKGIPHFQRKFLKSLQHSILTRRAIHFEANPYTIPPNLKDAISSSPTRVMITKVHWTCKMVKDIICSPWWRHWVFVHAKECTSLVGRARLYEENWKTALLRG